MSILVLPAIITVLWTAVGCSSPPVETGFVNRTIVDGDGVHRYQVFVPSDYERGRPLPVILFLHGAECGRTGFFTPYDRAEEWHYTHRPASVADLNCTWERFGYWRSAGFARRGVGGAPGFIVSQRVRELFESSGVRRVSYVPIVFANGA